MKPPAGFLDPLGPVCRSPAGMRWLIALLVYCVFFDLGTRSLHVHDTARWGQLAREMIQSGHWLVPHRYGELYVNKPPLYLWAVAGPSSWFGGVTPLWVRLPSALGLFALVVTTMSWANLRTGSVRLARTAGLLVLSTLSVVWLGREGRLDMMGAALSVGAMVQWDKAALGRGTRWTPWGAGLLLGLALLTKGPPLLIGPLVVLFAVSPTGTLGARLVRARPWIVLPVAVAVALAWFVPAVLQAGWEPYGKRLLVDQAADRIGGTSTHTHGPLYYLGAIPLGMAPWGLAYLAAMALLVKRTTRRALGALLPIALAGLVCLVVFSLFPTKHLRYLTPLVPVWALPVARGAWRWVHRDDAFPVARAHRVLVATWIVCGVAALGLALFARYDRAWWPPLVALPLLGLGASLHATRVPPTPQGRRILLGSTLVGVAVLLSAILALRSRWFTTVKETFVQEIVAVRQPGDRVGTLYGHTPELIFHVGPGTTKYDHPGQVPWDTTAATRWILLVHEDHVAQVESVSGRSATLIAARPDAHCVAVLLPPAGGGAGD